MFSDIPSLLIMNIFYFLDQLMKELIILLIFLKNPLLILFTLYCPFKIFWFFLYFLLFSFFYFGLFTLGDGSLKQSLDSRLYLFSFLIWALQIWFSSKHCFLLSPTNFQIFILCFLYHLFQNIFWPMCCLELCCLISKHLGLYQLSFCYWFLV